MKEGLVVRRVGNLLHYELLIDGKQHHGCVAGSYEALGFHIDQSLRAQKIARMYAKDRAAAPEKPREQPPITPTTAQKRGLIGGNTI